jgi:drug/metabolite transporter (DMT)-like permease
MKPGTFVPASFDTPSKLRVWSQPAVFVSEGLAIASAVCIALSSMFINELNGRVPLMRLARWQLTVAFLMTACASLVTGGWRLLDLWQLEMLAVSSLFGIAIASTTYFAAIYAAGPRITSLLFSLTSPFALVLGYAVFGETIDPVQGAGVGLILAGIVLALATPRPVPASMSAAAPQLPVPDVVAPPKSSWATPLWIGVTLGVVTALGQALGSLFARPTMASGVEPFTAMAVRSGLAMLFFYALLLLPLARSRATPFRLADFGLSATSSFFGTALGMSLLMAALKTGDVGIVSTLSSLTPIVILPMVWLRTGKRPTLRAWIGAALAIVGTALISLQ